MSLSTQRQLQERLDRLRLDLDNATIALGTALLNGNADAAGVVRAEIVKLESQVRDILAQIKARPSMDGADVTVERLQREQELADARNAARAAMKEAFAKYRTDFRKMNRSEKRAGAKELRAVASKAGRVQELKDFFAELAAQYSDEDLLKW